jgi:hypothetical protein
MNTNDIAEYVLQVAASTTVDVTEVRIMQAYGVERWGVGVGRNGKLLEYFEYAHQRGGVTATYFPISPSAPLCKPMPYHVHFAVMACLQNAAKVRYELECQKNIDWS